MNLEDNQTRIAYEYELARLYEERAALEAEIMTRELALGIIGVRPDELGD